MSYVAAGVAVAGMTTAYIAKKKADKAAKRKQKALENLPTPQLQNIGDGLKVSTRGADLRREQSGLNTSTATDSLRSSGARAVIGGLGNVQAQNNAMNADIGANLDEQQKNIDQIKAEDKARIRGITENRYNQDVAGLSSQINADNNTSAQSSANMLNFASTGAEAGSKIKWKKQSSPDSSAYSSYYSSPDRAVPKSIK